MTRGRWSGVVLVAAALSGVLAVQALGLVVAVLLGVVVIVAGALIAVVWGV